MKNPDQTSCIENDMMHTFAVKFSDIIFRFALFMGHSFTFSWE